MHASNLFRARGFTLLEVLAALVIVSLGMLAVIEAVGQTASNTSRMRDRTLAHWVAMNKLTATRLEQQPPKIDKTSDEVEMAGRRWRWTMDVTETPVESVRRIDITVAEAEAKAEASLATITGFYGQAIATTTAGVSVWQMGGQPQPGTEQPGTETPPEENPPPAPVPEGEPVDSPVDNTPQVEE